MSEQWEPLACPFCGGKCDPNGWMNVGGLTGPECEDCGATALDLDSWNHRIHPPGEVSEDAVDAVIVALLSAEDPELNHETLVRNNREIVRQVRAGAEHDGDCTGECHTCFVCLVSEYERKARAAIAALPAPPEREALREILALLAKAGDQVEDYGIVSNTLERAREKLSALLGEEK